MEDHHPIDDKIKAALTGFESDPPEHSWQGIQTRMTRDQVADDHRAFFAGLQLAVSGRVRLILTIAASLTVLVLSVVWVFYNSGRSVTGSAWAGEDRLERGTACLIRVVDAALPYDSVEVYKTVAINEKGQYHFPDVERGRYWLRVVPEAGSIHAKTHDTSWFDQRVPGDGPRLIEVDDEDVVLNIVLKRK